MLNLSINIPKYLKNLNRYLEPERDIIKKGKIAVENLVENGKVVKIKSTEGEYTPLFMKNIFGNINYKKSLKLWYAIGNSGANGIFYDPKDAYQLDGVVYARLLEQVS